MGRNMNNTMKFLQCLDASTCVCQRESPTGTTARLVLEDFVFVFSTLAQALELVNTTPKLCSTVLSCQINGMAFLIVRSMVPAERHRLEDAFGNNITSWATCAGV